MPKVYLTEADRITAAELRKLHGELLSFGIKNIEIAKWLRCTNQNVCQHWKKSTFSLKQYLIMKNELEKLKEKEQ